LCPHLYTACPYLPSVANTTLSYMYLSLDLEVGTHALYQCNDGFGPTEPSVLVCTEDFTWNGTAPNCTLICEQPPTFPNGTIEPDLIQYVSGDIVKFTCLGDYDLNGTSQLECKETGAWSHPFPTCFNDDCLPINNIQHAIVEYSNGQKEAYISCEDGYSLNGSSVLLCDSVGRWTPTLPTCFLTGYLIIYLFYIEHCPFSCLYFKL